MFKSFIQPILFNAPGLGLSIQVWSGFDQLIRNQIFRPLQIESDPFNGEFSSLIVWGMVAIALLALISLVFLGWRWHRGRLAAYHRWAMTPGAAFATLLMEQSDTLTAGRRYELTGSVTRIGRSASNDIVLPERPISRMHVELRYETGALRLVEMQTEQAGAAAPPRYGTAVNNAPVPAGGTLLKPGDRIRLGSRTVLRVERPQPARPDLVETVPNGNFRPLSGLAEGNATKPASEVAAQSLAITRVHVELETPVSDQPPTHFAEDDDITREFSEPTDGDEGDDRTQAVPPDGDDHSAVAGTRSLD